MGAKIKIGICEIYNKNIHGNWDEGQGKFYVSYLFSLEDFFLKEYEDVIDVMVDFYNRLPESKKNNSGILNYKSIIPIKGYKKNILDFSFKNLLIYKQRFELKKSNNKDYNLIIKNFAYNLPFQFQTMQNSMFAGSAIVCIFYFLITSFKKNKKKRAINNSGIELATAFIVAPLTPSLRFLPM